MLAAGDRGPRLLLRGRRAARTRREPVPDAGLKAESGTLPGYGRIRSLCVLIVPVPRVGVSAYDSLYVGSRSGFRGSTGSVPASPGMLHSESAGEFAAARARPAPPPWMGLQAPPGSAMPSRCRRPWPRTRSPSDDGVAWLHTCTWSVLVPDCLASATGAATAKSGDRTGEDEAQGVLVAVSHVDLSCRRERQLSHLASVRDLGLCVPASRRVCLCVMFQRPYRPAPAGVEREGARPWPDVLRREVERDVQAQPQAACPRGARSPRRAQAEGRGLPAAQRPRRAGEDRAVACRGGRRASACRRRTGSAGCASCAPGLMGIGRRTTCAAR